MITYTNMSTYNILWPRGLLLTTIIFGITMVLPVKADMLPVTPCEMFEANWTNSSGECNFYKDCINKWWIYEGTQNCITDQKELARIKKENEKKQKINEKKQKYSNRIREWCGKAGGELHDFYKFWATCSLTDKEIKTAILPYKILDSLYYIIPILLVARVIIYFLYKKWYFNNFIKKDPSEWSTPS